MDKIKEKTKEKTKEEKMPKGWKRVRLGEVLNEINDKVGKANLIPVSIGVGGLKIRSEIYYKELTSDYTNNKVLHYGCVAFGLGSKEMAIGVNVNAQDFCVSPAYKVFRIERGIVGNVAYFYYLIDLLKKYFGDKFLIISARQGKNVDFRMLFREEIIISSIPEQQKIAEILETADNAIEKTDQIIEKYKRMKQGLMQDLLTKGIDENWRIRSEKTHNFKDSPLGRIPEEWKVVRLEQVLTKCEYGLSQKFNKEGRYRILKMDDVDGWYVKPLYENYVDIPEKVFRNYKLRWGDILFNRTNSIDLVGRTTLFNLKGDFVFASYLIRLIPNKTSLNSLFLVAYLTLEKENIKKLATHGVSQANINALNLKKYIFPLPPLPEQHRIASVLSQMDETIEKETQYKQKLERIKQGLMEDLLTGKVRVNHLIDDRETEVNI